METKTSQTTPFLKSVARYFMDFLETDFKKRGVPKRSVKLKNRSGQLLGIVTGKYPEFDRELWQILSRKFDDEGTLSIRKNQFKAEIPANLMVLVRKKIESLDHEGIQAVADELADAILNFGVSLQDEYTKARDEIEDCLSKVIAENITSPLINSIEKSLLLLETADENTAYQITTELTELFVTEIMPLAETLLQAVVIGENVDVATNLEANLTLDFVKSLLAQFFEDLGTNDLFQELSEIESNRLMFDKQELYFYFFEVVFQNTKYPLFYIPLHLEKNAESLNLHFDSKVYINKKAIEYIGQEVRNVDSSVSGKPLDLERIWYLATFDGAESFTRKVQEILDQLIVYFDLRGELGLEAHHSIARSSVVSLDNSAYLALFDKTDEALINDYEQILDLDVDSDLFEEFEAIVNGFITEEPKDVTREVEREWDAESSTEKLAFESPIPLNSEQNQILRALAKNDCRFVTVEGPPGTGKSHTITALVFNAILNNQSVLVLSDKKEALDVVEDKIKSTLSKIRFHDKFQNPILRLGGINNFRQILSHQAIEDMKVSYRATEKNIKQLEESINGTLETVKSQIQMEIDVYSKIKRVELLELENLEKDLSSTLGQFEIEELLDTENIHVILKEFRQKHALLTHATGPNSRTTIDLSKLGIVTAQDLPTLSSETLQQFASLLGVLAKHVSTITADCNNGMLQRLFSEFPDIGESDIPELGNYVARLNSLKKPLVGFAFKKSKLAEMIVEINNRFGTSLTNTPSELVKLQELYAGFVHLKSQKDKLAFPEPIKDDLDYFMLIRNALSEPVFQAIAATSSWQSEITYLLQVSENLPANFGDISNLSLAEISQLPALVLSDSEFDRLARWLHLVTSLQTLSDQLPFYSYRQLMQKSQEQVATRMAQILDGRAIDFYSNNRATAATIKDIIKARQKFPKETFTKLKDAFPCILAGIREYADYIPLEAGIFDLVIIDEASQVSVAQAFPALIRGKKVVIMGDQLQFGNVKSYQARTEINTEYQNKLRESFSRTVSNDLSSMKKIERLDVKKSILNFAEFVSNYQIMLKKHFRSYPENISFSNKNFYVNGLQVMKVRGKQIDEVLKFSILDHDGKLETRSNCNRPEAGFIIEQLRLLAAQNDASNSIGIITPHANQQKLIIDLLRADRNYDFYIDKLKLKVMTFDTCQGEERDLIFYSMVATVSEDKLSYVFPRDIEQNSYDNDSESELRRQRLNVGFSRSKETMHFVLSKPIEDFHGSIGTAIAHYFNLKEEIKNRLSSESVDKNSPMEARVLQWIYETPFWQKNIESNRCELRAQFKLGLYLSQLDPTYRHPKYVVDFILFYKDGEGVSRKIIIEYDGFKEHIAAENKTFIDEGNFESYLKEDDIYRQKVLESYGYEFIRLNRFNLRSNPVGYLNARIEQLANGSASSVLSGQDVNEQIKNHALGLSNREMKECRDCGQVKALSEFKDPNLMSGMGRICVVCKTKKKTGNKTSKARKHNSLESGLVCPTCGKKLALRSGRYGPFWGCSGFPFCKYTTPVNLG